MTSENHKTGTDRIGEVAGKIDADLYVNIQGDEPLISPDEIRDLLKVFEDESVYFGSLRQEITNEEELKAASIVKIVVDCNQDALYFSRSVIPSCNAALYRRHKKHFIFAIPFLLTEF